MELAYIKRILICFKMDNIVRCTSWEALRKLVQKKKLLRAVLRNYPLSNYSSSLEFFSPTHIAHHTNVYFDKLVVHILSHHNLLSFNLKSPNLYFYPEISTVISLSSRSDRTHGHPTQTYTTLSCLAIVQRDSRHLAFR